jgi:endoglucanase
MKNTILLLLLILLGISDSGSQTVAHTRAERLELGMNLSYLDNYWRGTKDKKFADFVKPAEAAKRERMFSDIAANGFKTVRLPTSFGAWANFSAPFKWNKNNGLKTADKFVEWALKNDLNVIVDLHHVEFDGSVGDAATTERIVWLWQEIATRYKKTDPERVFFEIRNEPHDIPAAVWRKQAAEIIAAIRKIAPNHTLIVGFHDWNSRAALIESEPFADENIIYTFHYYDPFIFTHQGATWSSEGLPELQGVPFPFSKETKIEVPATAEGKWVGGLIGSYEADSAADKMYADLKAAKDWSVGHKVPIFLGEFGSYTKYAAPEDRCRHARVIYHALGRLNIPNAWWEWDGGFNMFGPEPNKLSDCMRGAVNAYKLARVKNIR